MALVFKKRRSVLGVIFILAVILGLVLIYNQHGFINLTKLGKERSDLEIKNKKIAGENRLLRLKIDRIKSDPDYVEDEARKKLGMVKPGEKIYRIKASSEPDKSASHEPANSAK